jgi:TFIIE alpha subunit
MEISNFIQKMSSSPLSIEAARCATLGPVGLKLSLDIVEEYFGETIRLIAEALSVIGPSTVSDIKRYFSHRKIESAATGPITNSVRIRKGLFVLLNQRFVKVHLQKRIKKTEENDKLVVQSLLPSSSSSSSRYSNANASSSTTGTANISSTKGKRSRKSKGVETPDAMSVPVAEGGRKYSSASSSKEAQGTVEYEVAATRYTFVVYAPFRLLHSSHLLSLVKSRFQLPGMSLSQTLMTMSAHVESNVVTEAARTLAKEIRRNETDSLSTPAPPEEAVSSSALDITSSEFFNANNMVKQTWKEMELAEFIVKEPGLLHYLTVGKSLDEVPAEELGSYLQLLRANSRKPSKALLAQSPPPEEEEEEAKEIFPSFAQKKRKVGVVLDDEDEEEEKAIAKLQIHGQKVSMLVSAPPKNIPTIDSVALQVDVDEESKSLYKFGYIAGFCEFRDVFVKRYLLSIYSSSSPTSIDKIYSKTKDEKHSLTSAVISACLHLAKSQPSRSAPRTDSAPPGNKKLVSKQSSSKRDAISASRRLHAITSPQFSVQEVFDEAKKSGEKLTLEGVHSVLEWFSEHPSKPFKLIHHNEHNVSMRTFSLQFRNIILSIQRRMVLNLVTEHYGVNGAKVVDLLLEKGSLEERSISDLLMIQAKELRELVYKLFKDGVIQMQEVPRRPDHHPQFTFYLYSAELPFLLLHYARTLHHFLLNVRVRRRMETARLRKAQEDIQRIGMTATGMPLVTSSGGISGGSLLGYEVIRTLEEGVKKLVASELRLNETLFCIRDMNWDSWKSNDAAFGDA